MTESSFTSEIKALCESKGHTLISDHLSNTKSQMQYLCLCGPRTQAVKDYKRNRGCRTCNSMRLRGVLLSNEVEVDLNEIPEEIDLDGERWKRHQSGWVSDQGRVKNLNKNLMDVYHDGRVKIIDNGNPKNKIKTKNGTQYIGIVMAKTFEIKDWEKLTDENYQVYKKDQTCSYNLDNIQVLPISQGRYKQYNDLRTPDVLRNIEAVTSGKYKIVPEFPDFKIYDNGCIWSNNKNTFLKGSYLPRDGYTVIRFKDGRTIGWHRLVAYAWCPIDGKNFYTDYADLEPNHLIVSNPANNHPNNLKWTTKAENSQYAYDNADNKKVLAVNCINQQTNEIIATYPSIASASRATNIAEHEIRSLVKNQDLSTKSLKKYNWTAVDEDKGKLFSIKFANK